MAPQRQKNQAPTEVAKCHPGFWGGIFSNFGERMERLQNSGWWLLFLSTVIFKVLNSVSVAISDWISKRNISCFGLFRYIISGCTGYIYI